MAKPMTTYPCTTCGKPVLVPAHTEELAPGVEETYRCGDCTRALLRTFAKEPEQEKLL